MKRYLTLLINFFLILSLLTPFSVLAAPPPPAPQSPAPEPLTPMQQELEQAILAEVKAHRSDTLYTQIYDIRVDHINIDESLGLATAWIVPVDPSTGDTVPTEPAIVTARLAADLHTWNVFLTTNPQYPSEIASLPDSMMPKEQRDVLSADVPVTPSTTEVFNGYYLPWLGGTTKLLVGSIWHAVAGGYASPSCPNTCFYAFDFSDGTMFPLLAAKGGKVWAFKDTSPNNSVGTPSKNYSDCDLFANYMIIEDTTTSPATYALYYHLAQGTIPANLKQAGAAVTRGDFIGRADNTGCSSGSHVHFQVFVTPNSAHWGASVDFTFNDVDINGGRPRRCDEAKAYPQYGSQCHTGDYFTSGNRAPTPPTGALTAPAAWTVLNSSTLTVSGSGTDNSAVSALQVVADYDGTWKPLTSQFTSNPFTVNIDLCAAGVPDGPLTVGLWVWDNEDTRTLNAQTPRPIVKNYSCQPQPPPCNPGLGEVALYTLPDYMGLCQVYSIAGGINSAGIYDTASLGAIGDNSAASIKVSANVLATVYDGNYASGAFAGRAESFDSSDPGLEDNRIGINHVSSLRVQSLAVPSAPTLNAPQSASGANPKSTDSLTLTWSGGGGGVQFQAALTYPDSSKHTSPWLTAISWSIGSLPAGSYSWAVTARNQAGSTTSNPSSFTVNSASLSGATVSFPFADNMSTGVNGWTATGLWRQSYSTTDTTNKFWVYNQSNGSADPSSGNYSASGALPGDLTSPPIALPGSGAMYLRFHEYFHTESSWPYWDQRRVQISVNGGPFNDIYQMVDDPADLWTDIYWVYSPFLDLSAYAGKTVRVRFHFDRIDTTDNDYLGWRIDDVSVSTAAPDVSQAESSSNDTPATAAPIAMNSSINGTICPVGDVDYYSFNVNAGDIVNFNIDAQSLTPASLLDSYIYLIDTDGHSILAQNDDEVSWVIRDSNLTYQFHRSGTYFLKVKSWSYPGSTYLNYTCANFFYTLKVYGSEFPPAITLTTPTLPWVGLSPVDVTAQISIASSGLASINFLWHSPDWVNDTWVTLSGITTTTTGWKAILDPTGKMINGSSLIARVTDRVGLSGTTWIASLLSDTTPPTTHLTGPTAENLSTVIPLTWSALDNGSGISTMEIQYKDITAATDWQPWNVVFGSSVRQAYFPGLPGHTYGFTMRGTDKVGNIEAYSPTPEIQPAIASTCMPDVADTTPANDNSQASANVLTLGAAQTHNFCPSGDQDWLKFSVPAAGDYLVRVQSLAGGAAANLDVTSTDGLTVLAHGQSPALGTGFDLKFSTAAAGDYKLHLSALNAGLWGTDMKYSVWVGKGNFVYMPRVGK